MKFLAEKIIGIDSMEREKSSLGLLLETTPKGNERTALEQESGIEDGERKWHDDYEFGNGLEIIETLLVFTSPRKLD